MILDTVLVTPGLGVSGHIGLVEYRMQLTLLRLIKTGKLIYFILFFYSFFFIRCNLSSSNSPVFAYFLLSKFIQTFVSVTDRLAAYSLPLTHTLSLPISFLFSLILLFT
ncbi:hypothetical protein ASPFODRAFT_353384 [Aspergillus luchuensis CBS 106.47]|uniref:Uncharacterized protein n=1 Tax=Aspergillus luchuensis (strain CBS 106.47) TaxID=1137211 RepID=A0A1M3T6E6_ASPLC|nr:hypothetical protein ASPFODRAFT_353384 [Aspergillus luchuensis CBS 106.47]